MKSFKKKSKQILIAALALSMFLGFLTPLMVHAEGDVSDLTGKTEYISQETTITSYAIYDKILHEDMIDGDASIGVDQIITMANGLVANAFVGTVFSRLHEDTTMNERPLANTIGDYLGGNGTLTRVTDGDVVDEVVFWSRGWQNNKKVLNIEEVKVGFYAVNMDGTYSIVDVYDALTTRRSYKEPYTHEEALNVMCTLRGTHFDPDLLDVFLSCEEEFCEMCKSFKEE